MLTGDNSILGRAQSTHAYNAIGKAKDEVNLAYNSAMTEYLRLKYDDGATPKTIDELFGQEITNLNTKMQAQNTSTGTTTVEYASKVVTITYTDLQSGKTYTSTATLNDTLGSEKLGTWTAIEEGVKTEKWVYDHATQTVTKGTDSLKIGDKVIDSTTSTTVKNKEWRVLGEENGQILLISSNYVDCTGFEGSTTFSEQPAMTLQGSDGLENCIDKLNNIGASFADNIKTEKGRSVNVEDINRITGYKPTEHRQSPTNLDQKDLYGKGQIYQYGNKVTYTLKAGVTNSGKTVVWYKGDQAQTTEKESSYTKFWPLGQNSDITSPYEVTSTVYDYYPETLGSFPGSDVTDATQQAKKEGIQTTSPAYDALFKPQNNLPYWLASSCVNAYEGAVDWNLFNVTPPGIVHFTSLWYSTDGLNSLTFGVRSAVRLKSDISPTKGATDANGITTWSI